MKHYLLTGLLLSTFAVFAEDRDSIYKHQLQLIDSLRTFIKSDLQLQIPNNFYTDWSGNSDSMYAFLYISRTDSIKPPDSLSAYYNYYDSESSAIAISDRLKAAGYQTMIYRTAGTSSSKLTKKLLSYSDESIAFILFHEATHNDLAKRIPKIPSYMYEEALCDVVADYGCARFASKTKMIDSVAAAKQREVFENDFALLNEERKKVEGVLQEEREDIYAYSTEKINQYTAEANQFQKDRMLYEVSNAYFFRMGPYALHYFEIKEMIGEQLNMDKVIENIWILARKYYPDELQSEQDKNHANPDMLAKPMLKLPENTDTNSFWQAQPHSWDKPK